MQVVGAPLQFIKLAPLARAIRQCSERPIEELIGDGRHYDYVVVVCGSSP
jgi:hypothetical protein